MEPRVFLFLDFLFVPREFDQGRRTMNADREERLEQEPEQTQVLAEYGFASEFRSLSICTTCLGLFDPPSREQGTFEQQRCACRKDNSEPRWCDPKGVRVDLDGTTYDYHVTYDFNERARLCDCCGRYILPSGSRWSSWFCGECKDRIVSLNEEFGFALIPIGRHSLMNRFGLRSGAHNVEIADFLQKFWDMSTRTDVLRSWKHKHLRAELSRLGLFSEAESRPRAIPLLTYFRAVAQEDQASGLNRRLNAFRNLADQFEVRELVDPEASLRSLWTAF
jgi:hypothetical protein